MSFPRYRYNILEGKYAQYRFEKSGGGRQTGRLNLYYYNENNDSILLSIIHSLQNLVFRIYILDKTISISIDNKVLHVSLDKFTSIIQSFLQKIKAQQEANRSLLIEVQKELKYQININKIQKKQIQRQSQAFEKLEAQKEQFILQQNQQVFVLEQIIQQQRLKLKQLPRLKGEIDILNKLKDDNISKYQSLQVQLKQLQVKMQRIVKNSIKYITEAQKSFKCKDLQNQIQRILQNFRLTFQPLYKENQQKFFFLSNLIQRLVNVYDQKIKENQENYNKLRKRQQLQQKVKREILNSLNKSKTHLNSLNEISLKLTPEIDSKYSIQACLYQIEQIANKLKFNSDNLHRQLDQPGMDCPISFD